MGKQVKRNKNEHWVIVLKYNTGFAASNLKEN